MKLAQRCLLLSLMVLPVVAPWQQTIAAASTADQASGKEKVITRPTFPPNLQLTEWQPTPDPIRLYGRASHGIGTPMRACMDDYYSGAKLRPGSLDSWFGNGYNF